MILIDPSNESIDNIIQELKNQMFNVTNEGQIKDYLRVRIEKLNDGKSKMSQHHLIQQILEDLNLEQRNCSSNETRYQAKLQNVPTPSMVILQ
jgi:hypothetical protein